MQNSCKYLIIELKARFSYKIIEQYYHSKTISPEKVIEHNHQKLLHLKQNQEPEYPHDHDVNIEHERSDLKKKSKTKKQ